MDMLELSTETGSLDFTEWTISWLVCLQGLTLLFIYCLIHSFNFAKNVHEFWLSIRFDYWFKGRKTVTIVTGVFLSLADALGHRPPPPHHHPPKCNLGLIMVILLTLSTGDIHLQSGRFTRRKAPTFCNVLLFTFFSHFLFLNECN